MRPTKILLISLLLSSLIPSFRASAATWEAIKKCDGDKMMIEKNENNDFRLIMRGNAVLYFSEKGAIPKNWANSNKEFVTKLFKFHNRFRATIRFQNKNEIIFDLHDYGNITLIATENNHELAAWNYRQCHLSSGKGQQN